MHTFARAISRHRCHRGGSQEPEEQPASKHSQSCWESLSVQLQRELSCSVWQRWSTAPAGSTLPFKAAARSLQLCKHTTHSRNSLQHSNTGNAAEINLSVTQEVQQSAQH